MPYPYHYTVPVNELVSLTWFIYICNPLPSALHRPSVLLAHFNSIYIRYSSPYILPPLSPLCRFFRQNNLTSCKCLSCSKVVSAALQFPSCSSVFSVVWQFNWCTHIHTHTYGQAGQHWRVCVRVCGRSQAFEQTAKKWHLLQRVKGPKGSPESRSGMQPAVSTWIIGEGLQYLPL